MLRFRLSVATHQRRESSAILRLEVSVNDTFTVQVDESFKDIAHDADTECNLCEHQHMATLIQSPTHRILVALDTL